MPNSLKVKLSKLRYKGQITNSEYKQLIDKLDGHDKDLYEKVYAQGFKDGMNRYKRVTAYILDAEPTKYDCVLDTKTHIIYKKSYLDKVFSKIEEVQEE